MINKEIDKRIDRWIQENKEKIISAWIDLAKIPSITSEKKENAPFGTECARALEFAASLFESEGIGVELDKEGGYALVSYGEGEKTIGLYSHSDVVPVGDGWLYTEPFKPIIKDGSLIGRGVEDNKSGIIASLCLIGFLKDNSIPISSKIEAFIGSDEECGMKDLEVYLKKHKIPDISFVPDADFPCSKGEKGIYHFWAKSKDKLNDISEIIGGDAFNIVLDDVNIKIRYSDELFGELKVKTENDDRFTVVKEDNYIYIRTKGISKHASIPEGSENAALTAFSVLSECENLSDKDCRILKNACSILGDYYGRGLDIYHEDENFGKLTSVNGMVKTEEGNLLLSFDVRYGDTLDSVILEEKSDKALKESGFFAILKNNSPGFSIPKESRIPEILEVIYEDITSFKEKSVFMSGGTYARKLKNAFSIGTSVVLPERKEDVFEMPDGHGGPHQRDERIDIEAFFAAVKILVHYVLECDRVINE